MKSIAIIPARGGSIRLPRKNLMSFAGRPLVEWTIVAALGSEAFDKVLVSTDSEEISQVSIGAGAEVPFYRMTHFDDHATSSEATVSALKQAEAHWSTEFDVVAQLLPTCPLRGAGLIEQMIQEFFAQANPSSMISANEFAFQPPWWAARNGPDGAPQYLFPESLQRRSQDLEKVVVPNGAIWIAHRSTLLRNQSFYTPGHKLFEIPWSAGLDIDTELDFKIAEFLCQHSDT